MDAFRRTRHRGRFCGYLFGPSGLMPPRGSEQHWVMTQSAPEQDDYEAWRDLQDVLEERDTEWWAGAEQDLDES